MRGQARKCEQFEQYSKQYAACVCDDVERVECASKQRTPEILRHLYETAEAKHRASTEECGADDPVLK